MEGNAYREYSTEDLRLVVAKAWADLRELQAGAAEHAIDIRGDRNGPVRRWLEGDEVHDACDRYLSNIEFAAARFLKVCEDVLILHQEYAEAVDAAFGLEQQCDGVPSPPHLAFEGLSGSELLSNVREIAFLYADRIEETQLRFHSAWETVSQEFATEQKIFEEVVSRRAGAAVDVLDNAIVTGVQAAAVGTCVTVAATGTAVLATAGTFLSVLTLPAACLGGGLLVLSAAAGAILERFA
ncbi:hypothetical protein AB0N09_37880 [Streptomyces erythrochromogenes]|uniref:hypothetical protein n=1 Tax=Streptomyces erythrochromogenes TaxID=285574 RepID=UPI00343360B6